MNSILSAILESTSKVDLSKRDVLKTLSLCDHSSIGEISEICNLSVPTTTKIIDEFVSNGIILDIGQRHKEGGRKPNMFALNPGTGYFVGLDIRNHTVSVGIMDFAGRLIYSKPLIPFELSSPGALDALLRTVRACIGESGIEQKRILVYTLSIPGRVNTNTGESFNYFTDVKGPLREVLKKELGAEVYVDNDSRVMCYGEYVHSNLSDFKNVLYINLSWGLGMGMVLDGKLYYGHTGFSGELGHVTIFDNEIFCRCGKKGCLETEASGSAMQRLLLAKHNAGARSVLSGKIEAGQTLSMEDFNSAVKSGDMLMIEIVEEVGTSLGKGIAAMINVFNPQLVILGGALAGTGDYLLMSTLASVRKYSLNLVNRETTFRLAAAGPDVDVLGCCYIARHKMMGIL